jgi:hypothetical protein
MKSVLCLEIFFCFCVCFCQTFSLLISELMKGNYIDHSGMSKQFSLQKNKMKF